MSTVEIPIVLPNDNGIRPAGSPDRCFYCDQYVGSPHKETCVCVNKRVRVRLTINYVIEVPYSWSNEDVEQHRNHGSWCADNCLNELESVQDQLGCLCGRASFQVIDTVAPGPYVYEHGQEGTYER